MYLMACAVHLLANSVHPLRLLMYMIASAVYFMANVVHTSEAPDVHFGRHSIREF